MVSLGCGNGGLDISIFHPRLTHSRPHHTDAITPPRTPEPEEPLIPVPVLGAVIGNTVGMVMYNVASSSLSRREAELIERYLKEQRILDEQLAAEYQELIDRLDATMAEYLAVLERAFSPDVQAALLGSIQLALILGVAANEILDSEEKILAYFLD